MSRSIRVSFNFLTLKCSLQFVQYRSEKYINFMSERRTGVQDSLVWERCSGKAEV